jgi:hypothetical protein
MFTEKFLLEKAVAALTEIDRLSVDFKAGPLPRINAVAKEVLLANSVTKTFGSIEPEHSEPDMYTRLVEVAVEVRQVTKPKETLFRIRKMLDEILKDLKPFERSGR